MREIRLALLEADVNFEFVKSFVAQVRERDLGQDVLCWQSGWHARPCHLPVRLSVRMPGRGPLARHSERCGRSPELPTRSHAGRGHTERERHRKLVPIAIWSPTLNARSEAMLGCASEIP
jgi:hypothetical protein